MFYDFLMRLLEDLEQVVVGEVDNGIHDEWPNERSRKEKIEER